MFKYKKMGKKVEVAANNSKDATSSQASRRAFLRTGATTGLIGAVSTLAVNSSVQAAPPGHASGRGNGLGTNGTGPNHGLHGAMSSDMRSTQDYARRLALCREYVNQAQQTPPQASNGDESRYSEQRYYASFTKTLPCNEFGEVDSEYFEALINAIKTGKSSDFDDLSLDPSAGYKLANPQGALKFQSCGLDGHAIRIAPAHRFSSPEIAGELVEVYWQSLTRDIPFVDFEENNLIAKAVRDLNDLSVTPAEKSNGSTSSSNIFRGETPGDLVGPYISQFLWQNFNFGPLHIEQRYPSPRPNSDFMQTQQDWLLIQKGGVPSQTAELRNRPRFIHSNRSLAEYVHRDVSFQSYLNAALILLGHGSSALDPRNPYLNSRNQGAFVSHGAPYILDLVNRAAQAALHAAWFQKWSVHRFLRPEALAARAHFHLNGDRNYDLHSDLLNSKALTIVSRRQGNYLLSQAYPEGSPTHPSYPAGHACIAGACVTILKALFNESFVFPEPVVANRSGKALDQYLDGELKVGDELNKLASNISFGRDAAGVHYRQDGVQGMRVGEQVAIALLQEESSAFNESSFAGYQFDSFSGDTITIKGGTVSSAS